MNIKKTLAGILVFMVGLAGTGTETAFASKRSAKAAVQKQTQKSMHSPKKQRENKRLKKQIKGVGSWYSRKSPGIRRVTASGERFDDSKITCALWHYPLGTRVRVTNLKNGKSVICRVNDRGPSRRLKRVIDMSKASFVKIGKLQEGLIPVSITPV